MVVFLVFGTAKSWCQYRDLIEGGFGIRACIKERRKKACSPIIGAHGSNTRDFEFNRLSSLRHNPSDDTIDQNSGLASRVRMLSKSAPVADKDNAYSNGVVDQASWPSGSERTANANAVDIA